MELQDLFKADSLDQLVSGQTNVPLALHEGLISEGALNRVLQFLQGEMMGWSPKLGHADEAVLRVEAVDRSVEYIAVNNDRADFNRYLFKGDGSFVSHQSGHRFTYWDLIASITVVYPLIRWQLPSVRRNATQHDKLSAFYARDVEANMRDAFAFAEPVTVYLGSTQDNPALSGRTLSPVRLDTPAKFVQGASLTAVQIAAHILGANALVNYQQGSPARGTPVIFS